MAHVDGWGAASPSLYSCILPASLAHEADESHNMISPPAFEDNWLGASTMDQDIHTSTISPLLSLPKELRLEIWKHVLTDPGSDKLVLCITREIGRSNSSSKRFSNSLYKHADVPEIRTYFENSPASPISVSLLRTSHLIYNEALPTLYHTVMFCPWDLQGIFPVFLDGLSIYAKAQIRHVKLVMERGLFNACAYFNWAVTCAQIAKMNETLRQIKVEGPRSMAPKQNEFIKRAILGPLLKIKAPKKFIGEYADELQQLLLEAEAQLEAKADLRKAMTEADAAERRRVTSNRRFIEHSPPSKRQKRPELSIRQKPREIQAVPDEREVAREMARLPGVEQFEKELSEWDMVSFGSKSPCASIDSRSVTDADTCAEAEPSPGERDSVRVLSDTESDEWELVDEHTFP